MRELDYLPMDEGKLRNQLADEAVRDLLTKYRRQDTGHSVSRI